MIFRQCHAAERLYLFAIMDGISAPYGVALRLQGKLVNFLKAIGCAHCLKQLPGAPKMLLPFCITHRQMSPDFEVNERPVRLYAQFFGSDERPPPFSVCGAVS